MLLVENRERKLDGSTMIQAKSSHTKTYFRLCCVVVGYMIGNCKQTIAMKMGKSFRSKYYNLPQARALQQRDELLKRANVMN